MQIQQYRGALAIAALGYKCSGRQATRRRHTKRRRLKSLKRAVPFVRKIKETPKYFAVDGKYAMSPLAVPFVPRFSFAILGPQGSPQSSLAKQHKQKQHTLLFQPTMQSFPILYSEPHLLYVSDLLPNDVIHGIIHLLSIIGLPFRLRRFHSCNLSSH
jgi:hypothetical protein